MNRRHFLLGAAATATAVSTSRFSLAAEAELQPVWKEIEKRHEESVKRLQTWIRQPSIAAENRGMAEGCELAMQMFRDAGFQSVAKIPTDGQPGIFATLDAGAPRTLGVYFMYDVKQVNPAEWSSPPFDAALIDKPGLGKVVVGRGAVNQKGPQATFLAALHAIQGAGRKLPINLVLVAEGEEEIASPHFPQVIERPEVIAALKNSQGMLLTDAAQDLDGSITMQLGAKGVVELELVSSGEHWGRGPAADLHSSEKARVDSPAWRLVHALNTLVSADGNEPAIPGFADKARPMSAAEKKMIEIAAKRLNEESAKKAMGVQHWIHDVSWQQSLELLMSRPTVNIEGLVGGYTGPGRQDDLATPRRGQTRSSPGARNDREGYARRAPSPLDETRLWRHRSQYDGRLRSQQHFDRLSLHSETAWHLPEGGDRSHHHAAQRRFVAGLRLHRRAATPAGRRLRPGPRRRSPRAQRIFSDRVG